jgi:hypothetical protein
MRLSYELASRVVGEDNDDWHKPVRIMCRFIKQLGLMPYVRPGICNLDDSVEIETKFLRGDQPFPESWYFIHWCNAMNGNSYEQDSTFHSMLRRYGCEA